MHRGNIQNKIMLKQALITQNGNLLFSVGVAMPALIGQLPVLKKLTVIR